MQENVLWRAVQRWAAEASENADHARRCGEEGFACAVVAERGERALRSAFAWRNCLETRRASELWCRAPLGRLRLSPRARKLVASASSFTLTRHGLFVAARRGRHVWLTGEIPGVHGIVRSAALRANFSRLQRLSGTRARVRVVDSHLPCVVDARFDNASAALADAAARPARAAAFASAAHAKPC